MPKRPCAFFLMLFPLVFAVSCASSMALALARRQFERGDPVGAVISASMSVKNNVKNYEAVDYLVSIYPGTVASLLGDADSAEKSVSAYHWESLVGILDKLHSIYDAVSLLPPVYRKNETVPVRFPVEYQRERLDRARQEAALVRYDEGILLAVRGNRISWRESHRRFMMASAFVPGFRDVEARMRQARELGSDKILVVPFVSEALDAGLSGFPAQFHETYRARLVEAGAQRSYIQVAERSQMEQLVREQELMVSALSDGRVPLDSSGILGANIIVFGRVSNLVAVYPTLTSRTLALEAVVEQDIPGAAPVNGEIPREKLTVFANAVIFRKFASLRASVSVQAINAENSLLIDALAITETEGDSHEWAIYSGDARALGNEIRALTHKKDRQIRVPQEMFVALCDRMAAKAVTQLLARIPD